MAASPNVELEAAKFLHKLIQESTDEPTKLATKLYVILQHMRSSGKENSMPYQVISRAMETVINQHGLDIEALMSSRFPSNTGVQVGNTSSSQLAGSSLTFPTGRDYEIGLPEKDLADLHPSSRSSVIRSSVGHDGRQGSLSQVSNKSFEQESPSSFETRSANSQSQERRDVTQNDSKKAKGKGKRGVSSSTVEQRIDNICERASMGKLANKVEASESLPFLVGQQGQLNKANDNTLVDHSLKTTYNSNSMSRGPSIKYPGVEASLIQSLQPGSSAPPTTDAFNARSSTWKSAGNVTGSATGTHRYVEPGISNPMHFNSVSFNNPGAAKLKQERNTEASPVTTPSIDSSAAKSTTDSEYWKHGNPIGSSSAVLSKTGACQFISSSHGDLASSTLFAGKAMEQDGDQSNAYINNNKLIQGGVPVNNMEANMLRAAPSRDTGKSPITQTHVFSSMPFKDQHLKQLRAQCLVFLAFRNNVPPKKLHLEIALGNFLSKEDEPRKELVYNKGEEQSMSESNGIPVNFPSRLIITKEAETSLPTSSSSEIGPQVSIAKTDQVENKDGLTSNHSLHAEERNFHSYSARGREAEIPESRMFLVETPESRMSLNLFESSINGKSISSQQNQSICEHDIQGMCYADNCLARDQGKPILVRETENHAVGLTGTNLLAKNVLEHSNFLSGDDVERNVGPIGPMVTDQYEGDNSDGGYLPPSLKYTTSEKWIMDQKKRRGLIEQTWRLKRQKTEQSIGTCFEKLKEIVSSSEDISAKTRSVIELKKLQLLEIQRRLRSDILSDFFRPIATEMDRLKTIKKSKLGRRPRQIERFEQKMKEERQRRTRERQKEFFSEIEVHKERLDDVLKMKRERWKGFNRYAREFHKRKERVHREKIDRIHREKINLLKINDVEGYLRMVQDAKSDRVKQLLKETEKYLQKLGSKLQEAKATARHSETDIDDSFVSNFFENNEVENEDETDQAKHYMENNEKYYRMAHTVKETIGEQPTSLEGGKLREYQLNGLRWLVSLYNNHLNGILADEMGLGKTVQVISLICYLMETKNDRGPFLVVVPSSVLPGWVSEISFWAPSINKIVYSGPPEERRRLFKERIVHLKFNVLLTTYEYLMNKHDRPKLSKVDWHYIIIDEGHRIKNASCKLNADLKQYRSLHRLLLTGTPLQNNLEELWALLNFLLPNIFNASCDFSQWFKKPFESNGDNSPDEALLSEEENLLIINRLHQVLRPFVLRRLKHKVENELPEKIERLVRCEASSYQKHLMRRVDENLGAIGTSKARTIQNSVMELRNICNHPYLSQLHVEEVHEYVPKHYLPNVVRLCGKLEMLDRLLPKLKATGHRVLFFSTMTRLLNIMEDYLWWKQYRYLRLDGHTSGGDRGGLIDQFNQPNSPFFIFLLSIRAGGVGVNLQAADTVIIFDTDWNPQVDLQAQARAHRIGQKKDVLVLRLETVHSVEEQVRAAAEHKLGVANQSITAGFFDNNTSAEDRREYLEALLRESKTEEATPVLGDDALNYLIARSESEIDVFESVDKQRKEEELVMWKNMMVEQGKNTCDLPHHLPSRLLTDDDIRPFYEAMRISEVSAPRVVLTSGSKRKRGQGGGLDTQHYGRGKRAREVRNYEEQWTEEEFEKMCKADSPDSPKPEVEKNLSGLADDFTTDAKLEPTDASMLPPDDPAGTPTQQNKDVSPPTCATSSTKRGRGRPKRVKVDISSTAAVPTPSTVSTTNLTPKKAPVSGNPMTLAPVSLPTLTEEVAASSPQATPQLPSVVSPTQPAYTSTSVLENVNVQDNKPQGVAATPRRRGRKSTSAAQTQLPSAPAIKSEMGTERENLLNSPIALSHDTPPGFTPVKTLPLPVRPASFGDKRELEVIPVVSVADSSPATSVASSITVTVHNEGVSVLNSAQDDSPSLPSSSVVSQSVIVDPGVTKQPGRGLGSRSSVEFQVPRRRGRKSAMMEPVCDQVVGQIPQLNEHTKGRGRGGKAINTRRKRELEALEVMNNTRQEVGSSQLLDLASKSKEQNNVLSIEENVDKFCGKPHKDKIDEKTFENDDTALENTPISMDNETASGNSVIAVEMKKPDVLVSCGRQDQRSRVEQSNNSCNKQENKLSTNEGTDKHANKYGIDITEVVELRDELTHKNVVISDLKLINNQHSDTKPLYLSTESEKVSSTLEVKNDAEVQPSDLCSDELPLHTTELGEQKMNTIIQQQNCLSIDVKDGNGTDKVDTTTLSFLNSVKFTEEEINQSMDKISDAEDKIREGDSISSLLMKSEPLIEKAHESECGDSVSTAEITDKQSFVTEAPAAPKVVASDFSLTTISSEPSLGVHITETQISDVSIEAAPVSNTMEGFSPDIQNVDGQDGDCDDSVIEKVFVSASVEADKQSLVIFEPEALVVLASDSTRTAVVPEIEKVDGQDGDYNDSVIRKVFVSTSEGYDKQSMVIGEPEALVVSDSTMTDVVPEMENVHGQDGDCDDSAIKKVSVSEFEGADKQVPMIGESEGLVVSASDSTMTEVVPEIAKVDRQDGDLDDSAIERVFGSASEWADKQSLVIDETEALLVSASDSTMPGVVPEDGQDGDRDDSAIEKVFLSASERADKQSLMIVEPEALVVSASDSTMTGVVPEIEKVDEQDGDPDDSVNKKVYMSASEGTDKQSLMIVEPEGLIVSASDSTKTDVVPEIEKVGGQDGDCVDSVIEQVYVSASERADKQNLVIVEAEALVVSDSAMTDVVPEDVQIGDLDDSVTEKLFVSAFEGADKQSLVIVEPEAQLVAVSDSTMTGVVPGQALDVSTDVAHTARLKISPPENKLQKGECSGDHSEKLETIIEKLNGDGTDNSVLKKAILAQEALATIDMPGSDLKESNVIEKQATEDIATTNLDPYKQMENAHNQGLREKPLSESETKMGASGLDPKVPEESMNNSVLVTEYVKSLNPKGSQMEITNPTSESGIESEGGTPLILGDLVPGNAQISETEVLTHLDVLENAHFDASSFKVETSHDMTDHHSGGDDKIGILLNDETGSTAKPLKSPDEENLFTENMDMDTTVDCGRGDEGHSGDPTDASCAIKENNEGVHDDIAKMDAILVQNALSETENTNMEMSSVVNAKIDGLIDQGCPNVPAQNNLGNMLSSGCKADNQAGNNDSSSGHSNESNLEEEEAHPSQKDTVDVRITESFDAVMIDVQPSSEAQLMDLDPKQSDSFGQTRCQADTATTDVVIEENKIQEHDIVMQSTSSSIMPSFVAEPRPGVGEFPSQGLQILSIADKEDVEAGEAQSQLPETKVEENQGHANLSPVEAREEEAAMEEDAIVVKRGLIQ